MSAEGLTRRPEAQRREVLNKAAEAGAAGVIREDIEAALALPHGLALKRLSELVELGLMACPGHTRRSSRHGHAAPIYVLTDYGREEMRR